MSPRLILLKYLLPSNNTVIQLIFLAVCVCAIGTSAKADTITIDSNFNGTAIQFPSYIWFNVHLSNVNGEAQGTTVSLNNSFFDFTANMTNFHLAVPNATITFGPAATSPSTTFAGGAFNTSVPITQGGDIFLTGLAFQVPNPGLPGGINPSHSPVISSATRLVCQLAYNERPSIPRSVQIIMRSAFERLMGEGSMLEHLLTLRIS